MKVIILVCCVVLAAQRGVFADDVYVDGVKHREELLLNNAYLTLYSLAIDYSYNNLYYIDNNRPAVLSLNSGEHKYIEGVSAETRCFALDQETHELYIGTSQGVYKYEPSTDAVVLLVGSAGDDVRRTVVFKGVLYYKKYNSNRALTSSNGHSEAEYSVYGSVIDSEGVVFFRNGTGLYSQQRHSDQETLYYNKTIVNELVLDRNDNVYFITNGMLFEIIKYNASFRNVVTTKEFYSMAFDINNNIIYSTRKEIYRLKPTAEASDTEDCSVRQPDFVNNGSIMDLEKQMERNFDNLYKQIEKLVSDQMMEKLEGINSKIDNLSQKVVILTDQVEKKMEAEKSDEKPLTGRAEEQLQSGKSFPRTIHIDIRN